MKGTVKWWNDAKGFGYITGEDDQDYFVHFSGIVMPQGRHFRTMMEGDSVEFETEEGPKGPQAANVRIIEGTHPISREKYKGQYDDPPPKPEYDTRLKDIESQIETIRAARASTFRHLHRWLTIIDAPLGTNGSDLFNQYGEKIMSVEAGGDRRQEEIASAVQWIINLAHELVQAEREEGDYP